MAADRIAGVLRLVAPEPGAIPHLSPLWRRGRQQRQRRRVATAAVLVLVAGGVLGGLGRLGRVGDTDVTAGHGTRHTWRWEAVSDPPLAARSQSSAIWTGAEVLLWGGANADSALADGAAFDPGAEVWRLLAPAPLIGRVGHVAVWTGSNMIVWGGGRVDRGQPGAPGAAVVGMDAGTDPPIDLYGAAFADGASYDPLADAWTKIAPAPFPLEPYTSAWTGTEVIIVGHRLRFEGSSGSPGSTTGTMQGLAYNPAIDAWRVTAAPPFPRQRTVEGAWTGTSLLMWGGTDHEGATGPTVGFAYEPSHDMWTAIPTGPLSDRQWHTVVWTGKELVAWGGTDLVGPDKSDGATFDPATGEWERISSPPIAGRRDHSAVAFGRGMVVWGGSSGPAQERDGAVYDVISDDWTLLPDGPLSGRSRAAAAAVATGIFVWGGESQVDESEHFADGAMLVPFESG